jgi:hypothetical protein
MGNFNIRDWQNKYLLQESSLSEFALSFDNRPELGFDIISEEEIDQAVLDITTTFTHSPFVKRGLTGQQMLALEREVEEQLMKVIVKMGQNTWNHINKLNVEQ